MNRFRGARTLDVARFLYRMPQFARVFPRLLRDNRVPFAAKMIPLAALLYFLSPLDLSIDMIPVIGHVDDLAVAIFALRTFVKLSPQEVVREHLSAVSPGANTGNVL